MKICIYGAGAVGSHFAAKLANAGEAVSVVARGEHLDAIARDGIRLLSGGQTITARVTATQDPQTLGQQDLVIVTLKGPALGGIVDTIKPLLGPATPVIFAMNGIQWWYFYGLDPAGQERQLDRLDPGQRWWREIGPQRVIGAVVYSANEVTAPGVVENRSSARNQLRIAEPDGRPSERVERINRVLARVDMAAPVDDIRATIWEKLLGNIAYGPIACLTGATITEIRNNPDLRQLAAALMNEAIATAAATGTALEATAESRMAGTLSSGHKPSMLQDLERGRPMEIDAIVAVPRDLARAAAIATPALDMVLALLQERARRAGCYPG